MERDTILRIYSMTKPVTAVAYKILEERGLIGQADLVSQFLPEFANCKVIKDGLLAPMEREIRIGDLLTMTSGLVYPDLDEAVKNAQKELEDWGRRWIYHQRGSSKNCFGTVGISAGRAMEIWIVYRCAGRHH